MGYDNKEVLSCFIFPFVKKSYIIACLHADGSGPVERKELTMRSDVLDLELGKGLA